MDVVRSEHLFWGVKLASLPGGLTSEVLRKKVEIFIYCHIFRLGTTGTTVYSPQEKAVVAKHLANSKSDLSRGVGWCISFSLRDGLLFAL